MNSIAEAVENLKINLQKVRRSILETNGHAIQDQKPKLQKLSNEPIQDDEALLDDLQILLNEFSNLSIVINEIQLMTEANPQKSVKMS